MGDVVDQRTHLIAGAALPQLQIGTWTRVEWTADILVIGLFLITAMAVWIEQSEGVSALVSKASYAVVGFLTLDLLAAAWGMISLLLQRLLVAIHDRPLLHGHDPRGGSASPGRAARRGETPRSPRRPNA